MSVGGWLRSVNQHTTAARGLRSVRLPAGVVPWCLRDVASRDAAGLQAAPTSVSQELLFRAIPFRQSTPRV
jgi:hypothetical protein